MVYVGANDTARISYDDRGGKKATVRKSALRFRHEYTAEVEPAPAPKRVVRARRRSDRAFASMPKQSAVRSRSYMDFVKGHACCVCQAPPPSDPHHYGPAGTKGMGTKTDDLRTVPLCRSCHDEFHAKAEVRGESGKDLALTFYREQIRLLVKWFTEKENE